MSSTNPTKPNTTPPSADASAAQPTITTIEIQKEYLHFSSAHFTLFSATDRENLHGHNFQVGAEIEAEVDETGLCFDYNLIKTALRDICNELDEQMLLPQHSPWLRLESNNTHIIAHFNGEAIYFLNRDAMTLPVRNITVEELAGWILARVRNAPSVRDLPIRKLLIRVASGADQWARSVWESDS